MINYCDPIICHYTWLLRKKIHTRPKMKTKKILFLCVLIVNNNGLVAGQPESQSVRWG